MLRRFLRSAGLLVLLANAVPGQIGGGGGGGEIHKNVLVIVLDDLGTDKLSFYGEMPPNCQYWDCTCGGQPCSCAPPPCYCDTIQHGCVEPYPLTPNLDNLRRQGIWFRNAYAMPLCSPTRACIQTGRYPLRTGMGRALHADDTFSLADSEKTLAELVRQGFPNPLPLGNLPYKCGAFGKWHLATATDYTHATRNGYHRFYGPTGNLTSHFVWQKVENNFNPPSTQFVNYDGSATNPAFEADSWTASVTSADALSWILAQNKAWLAYVCFNPPHEPWTVPPFSHLTLQTQKELQCAELVPGGGTPPQYCNEQLLLIYRAQVEAVDYAIGQLVNQIPQNVLNNTMIFVVGDNGTPPQVTEYDGVPPLPPQHGKGTLMQGGIRVPLIVKGPLVPTPPTNEGWESQALVSVVDLWRTIRDVTGANEALVAPPQLDSVSFMSVIQNPQSLGSRTSVFSQIFEPFGVWPGPACGPSFSMQRRATTNGLYKYQRRFIPNVGPCPHPMSSCDDDGIEDTPCYSEHLFDLVNDPREETDIMLGGEPNPTSTHGINLAFLRTEMNAITGW